MAEQHGIELIPEELEGAKRQKRIVFLARAVGFAVLGVSLFITAVLFAISRAQLSSLNRVNRQIADREEQIGNLAEVEEQVLSLEDKSAVLTSVLENRDYHSVLLEALAASTPSGVTLTAVSTSAGETTVGLTGETSDYTALANFLRNIVDPDKGGSLFEQVALTSVSYEPSEGKAQFNADLTMKEDGLKGGWEDLLEEGWEEASEEED